MSIAAGGFLVESGTDAPLRVRPDKCKHDRLHFVQTEYLLDKGICQKVADTPGSVTTLVNSTLPLKSDEFVPPRVKTPSATRAVSLGGF